VRIGRFLRNEKVSEAEIFATAAVRAQERCAGRHVIAIQDTTSVKAPPKGGIGLRLHPTLLVDADDGAILGIAGAEFLAPGDGRAEQRRERTADEKESARWLRGVRWAQAAAEGAARLTVIADRESDVFGCFAECPPGCGLVVRSAQNRSIAVEEKGAPKSLVGLLGALEPAGLMQVELPPTAGRKARTMTLELRFSPVALKRPPNKTKLTPEEKARAKAGTLAKTAPLFVVHAREIDPPEGMERADWRLLTNEAVRDLADARRIVTLYRRRWAIEQVFRTMKTKGFDIEAVRMEDDRPRRVLVAATLVAAVTVQQMLHDRDGAAKRPLEDAFDPDDAPALEAVCRRLEGDTQKQKNPHPRGTLAYAAWVCARLGGWDGYYGKPGPVVLVRGWNKFKRIKHGWTIAKHDV
jgi:hypothetical protein